MCESLTVVRSLGWILEAHISGVLLSPPTVSEQLVYAHLKGGNLCGTSRKASRLVLVVQKKEMKTFSKTMALAALSQ